MTAQKTCRDCPKYSALREKWATDGKYDLFLCKRDHEVKEVKEMCEESNMNGDIHVKLDGKVIGHVEHWVPRAHIDIPMCIRLKVSETECLDFTVDLDYGLKLVKSDRDLDNLEATEVSKTSLHEALEIMKEKSND
jgi:uncharacterized protein YuzE